MANNIKVRFNDLCRKIGRTVRNDECSKYLINYVSDIYTNKKVNNFFDFDFLEEIMNVIIEDSYESSYELKLYLERYEKIVRSYLPQGIYTDNYLKIKEDLLINYWDIVRKNLYDESLKAILETSENYLSVINIIRNDKRLINEFPKIVEYSNKIADATANLNTRKIEIISYISDSVRLSAPLDVEVRKTRDKLYAMNGYHPNLSEEKLAATDANLIRAQSTLTELEDAISKADSKAAIIKQDADDAVQRVNEAGERNVGKIETEFSKQAANKRSELDNFIEEKKGVLGREADDLQSQMRNEASKCESNIITTGNNASRRVIEKSKDIISSANKTLSDLSSYVSKDVNGAIVDLENKLDEVKAVMESESVQAVVHYTAQHQNVLTSVVAANSADKQIDTSAQEVVLPSMSSFLPQAPFYMAKSIDGSSNDPDFSIGGYEKVQGMIPAFDSEKYSYNEREAMVLEEVKKMEEKGEYISSAFYDALSFYLNQTKIPVFYGPTQAGKTRAANLLAKAVGATCIDGNSIDSVPDSESYAKIDGLLQMTPLIYALKYGLTVRYDEVDAFYVPGLVNFGNYSSALREKINNPTMKKSVTFAKVFVLNDINPNARIVLTMNTDGSGNDPLFQYRNKMDESSNERWVYIYAGYSQGVEKKILGEFGGIYEFFVFFRQACLNYANAQRRKKVSGAPGNVSTDDAICIRKEICQQTMRPRDIMQTYFVQKKSEEYLNDIIAQLETSYSYIPTYSEEQLYNMMRSDSKELNAAQWAGVFRTQAKTHLQEVRTNTIR